MLHFDWTVHLGDVLTILAIVGSVTLSGWRAVTAFKQRMASLEQELRDFGIKFDLVWVWFQREHALANGSHTEAVG